MVTFYTLTDGAELQVRRLGSDRHSIATGPVDQFVEVLSLVLRSLWRPMRWKVE